MPVPEHAKAIRLILPARLCSRALCTRGRKRVCAEGDNFIKSCVVADTSENVGLYKVERGKKFQNAVGGRRVRTGSRARAKLG